MKLLKERFHPCCGFFVGGVVRWLPILEIMLMTVATALLSAGIARKWPEWKNDEIHNHTNYYIRLVLWVGYSFHILSTLGLALVLLRGCRSKKPILLRIWTVCTPISILYTLVLMFVNMFRFSKFNPNWFGMVFGYAFLKLYITYVVYYHMKDMEVEILMSSALRPLTEAELQAFENGIEPSFNIRDLDLKTKYLIDQIQYQRYKKEDFEIDLADLQFEMGNPLGLGEYGAVYKAILTSGPRFSDTRTVAVKTVAPEDMDVIYFKALLSELKVMTYTGRHQNVVNLIGASTADIVRRSLYIVLEFCALGDLHSFLRGYRGLFRNQVRNGQLIQENYGFGLDLLKLVTNYSCSIPIESHTDSISTRDLIKWSYEIALGMEFLASKKVIHGDLATRNVLLTDTRTAKITDFGLARQLYNYSVYVKKQNSPLPWRWLSLESMTDMSYSSLSDVWSYGVTLWEIFTLAEVPYAGYNFGLQFVQDLKNGMRPPCPPFATSEMHKLMEKCWQSEPKSRPTFADIAVLLSLLPMAGPSVGD